MGTIRYDEPRVFDRNCALTLLFGLAAFAGCDSDNQAPASTERAPAPVIRKDGPAYIAQPRSGILELAANATTPLKLPLARHRPGRSDLWLDGQLLGAEPWPWQMSRSTLEVPLSGAMVHGPHALALVTAQYEQFPRSAPLFLSVLPAKPAQLKLSPQSAIDRSVARIFYPGVGTLFGGQIAWLLKPQEGQAVQLEIQGPGISTALPLFGEHPPFTQLRSLAIYSKGDDAEVVAFFRDDPATLWQWTLQGSTRRLRSLRLPASQDAVIDQLAVDASGFWMSGRESAAKSRPTQRPGDLKTWRLQSSLAGDSEATIQTVSPRQLPSSRGVADLRIAGVTRVLHPLGNRPHLTLAVDGWRPTSGPAPGQAIDLARWQQDARPFSLQRCATLSPLLDEVWVGLDRRANLHAGSQRGDRVQRFALTKPQSPRLALAPQPLDCSVFDGRFVAAVPRKAPLPLRILHFDGAHMHEQDSAESCDDAAFAGFGEQTRLWCLRDGSLFPMTLQWQDPKAPPKRLPKERVP